jgi:hypothetical protein
LSRQADNGFSTLYRADLLRELKAYIYEKGSYLEKLEIMQKLRKLGNAGICQKLSLFGCQSSPKS